MRNLVALCLYLALVPGCGYTLRSAISTDIKINIATFENRTFEHAIEVKLSKIVTNEFILSGALSVVDISRADIQLTGEILEYVLEPYTYGATKTDVEQYRVLVRVSVSLTDTDTGEAIWEEKKMEGDGTYHLSGSRARTEDEALEDALDELAKAIVSKVVTGW